LRLCGRREATFSKITSLAVVTPVLLILGSMVNWHHHSLVAAPVLEDFSTHREINGAPAIRRMHRNS